MAVTDCRAWIARVAALGELSALMPAMSLRTTPLEVIWIAPLELRARMPIEPRPVSVTPAVWMVIAPLASVASTPKPPAAVPVTRPKVVSTEIVPVPAAWVVTPLVPLTVEPVVTCTLPLPVAVVALMPAPFVAPTAPTALTVTAPPCDVPLTPMPLVAVTRPVEVMLTAPLPAVVPLMPMPAVTTDLESMTIWLWSLLLVRRASMPAPARPPCRVVPASVATLMPTEVVVPSPMPALVARISVTVDQMSVVAFFTLTVTVPAPAPVTWAITPSLPTEVTLEPMSSPTLTSTLPVADCAVTPLVAVPLITPPSAVLAVTLPEPVAMALMPSPPVALMPAVRPEPLPPITIAPFTERASIALPLPDVTVPRVSIPIVPAPLVAARMPVALPPVSLIAETLPPRLITMLDVPPPELLPPLMLSARTP